MLIINWCASFIANIAKTIRFSLGPPGCCRFSVTCMQYAKIQLKEHAFPRALYNICSRLLICNPFYRG